MHRIKSHLNHWLCMLHSWSSLIKTCLGGPNTERPKLWGQICSHTAWLSRKSLMESAANSRTWNNTNLQSACFNFAPLSPKWLSLLDYSDFPPCTHAPARLRKKSWDRNAKPSFNLQQLMRSYLLGCTERKTAKQAARGFLLKTKGSENL